MTDFKTSVRKLLLPLKLPSFSLYGFSMNHVSFLPWLSGNPESRSSLNHTKCASPYDLPMCVTLGPTQAPLVARNSSQQREDLWQRDRGHKGKPIGH